MSSSTANPLQSWLSLPSSALGMPPRLLEIVSQQAERDLAEHPNDQRAVHRLPVASQITVVSVDENLTPIGPAMSALSRDLSTRGIGFMCGAPPTSNSLVIVVDLPTGRVALTAEVRRVREIEPGCCEVGARFVGRIGDSAASAATEAAAEQPQ